MKKSHLAISLVVMAAFCMCVLIGLSYMWADSLMPHITLSPETTVITAPLLPDGSPDYIKVLNDQYSAGVTPENNAFTAWLELIGTEKVLSSKNKAQILAMSGAKDTGEKIWPRYSEFLADAGKPEDDPNDDERLAGQRLWSPEDFPELADYLKAKESILDGTKEAFRREKYWMPYVAADGRSMYQVLLPSLGKYREVVNGFGARATLRANAGDYDGFLSDVVACKRMSRMICGPILIERLVGAACETTVNKAAGAVAGSGKLNTEQCEKLRRELSQFGELPTMWESVDRAERWGWLNFTMQLALGNSNGLADISFGDNDTFSKSMMKITSRDVEWNAVLKEFNARADQLVAAFKAPSHDEFQVIHQKMVKELQDAKVSLEPGWNHKKWGETPEAYTKRIASALTSYLVTDLQNSDRLYRQSVASNQMALAVIAAAQYRTKNGNWPENLNKLVPDYLAAVPKDVFSKNGAEDVQCKHDEHGFRVISIGYNGKEFFVGAMK